MIISNNINNQFANAVLIVQITSQPQEIGGCRMLTRQI
jgi:hypothetical protein